MPFWQVVGVAARALELAGEDAGDETRRALQRFVDTTLTNLHRITLIWPLVTQFLLPVANHKTLRIRVLVALALTAV